MHMYVCMYVLISFLDRSFRIHLVPAIVFFLSIQTASFVLSLSLKLARQ